MAGADRDLQISDADKILGLDYNGIAKAYPINILNYHEIVNDQFAATPIVITFCPLCGTGMVFLANPGDKLAISTTAYAMGFSHRRTQLGVNIE